MSDGPGKTQFEHFGEQSETQDAWEARRAAEAAKRAEVEHKGEGGAGPRDIGDDGNETSASGPRISMATELKVVGVLVVIALVGIAVALSSDLTALPFAGPASGTGSTSGSSTDAHDTDVSGDEVEQAEAARGARLEAERVRVQRERRAAARRAQEEERKRLEEEKRRDEARRRAACKGSSSGDCDDCRSWRFTSIAFSPSRRSEVGTSSELRLNISVLDRRGQSKYAKWFHGKSLISTRLEKPIKARPGDTVKYYAKEKDLFFDDPLGRGSISVPAKLPDGKLELRDLTLRGRCVR